MFSRVLIPSLKSQAFRRSDNAAYEIIKEIHEDAITGSFLQTNLCLILDFCHIFYIKSRSESIRGLHSKSLDLNSCGLTALIHTLNAIMKQLNRKEGAGVIGLGGLVQDICHPSNRFLYRIEALSDICMQWLRNRCNNLKISISTMAANQAVSELLLQIFLEVQYSNSDYVRRN